MRNETDGFGAMFRAAAVGVALTVALTACASGEDVPSVDQIVDNALRANYYQGRDGRAGVSMQILRFAGQAASARADHPAP